MAGMVNLQSIDYEIEDLIDYDVIYPKSHSQFIVKLDKKLTWFES